MTDVIVILAIILLAAVAVFGQVFFVLWILRSRAARDDWERQQRIYGKKDEAK